MWRKWEREWKWRMRIVMGVADLDALLLEKVLAVRAVVTRSATNVGITLGRIVRPCDRQTKSWRLRQAGS